MMIRHCNFLRSFTQNLPKDYVATATTVTSSTTTTTTVAPAMTLASAPLVKTREPGSLQEGNQAWVDQIGSGPGITVYRFKYRLESHYRNLSFEKFDELYNYLAISKENRDKLIVNNALDQSYILRYSDGQYAWELMSNKKHLL